MYGQHALNARREAEHAKRLAELEATISSLRTRLLKRDNLFKATKATLKASQRDLETNGQRLLVANEKIASYTLLVKELNASWTQSLWKVGQLQRQLEATEILGKQNSEQNVKNSEAIKELKFQLNMFQVKNENLQSLLGFWKDVFVFCFYIGFVFGMIFFMDFLFSKELSKLQKEYENFLKKFSDPNPATTTPARAPAPLRSAPIIPPFSPFVVPTLTNDNTPTNTPMNTPTGPPTEIAPTPTNTPPITPTQNSPKSMGSSSSEGEDDIIEISTSDEENSEEYSKQRQIDSLAREIEKLEEISKRYDLVKTQADNKLLVMDIEKEKGKEKKEEKERILETFRRERDSMIQIYMEEKKKKKEEEHFCVLDENDENDVDEEDEIFDGDNTIIQNESPEKEEEKDNEENEQDSDSDDDIVIRIKNGAKKEPKFAEKLLRFGPYRDNPFPDLSEDDLEQCPLPPPSPSPSSPPSSPLQFLLDEDVEHLIEMYQKWTL